MSEVNETPTPAETAGVGGGNYEQFAHGETGTTTGGDVGFADKPLDEFRSQYRGEYIEPRATTTPVAPFDNPDRIAETINPKADDGREYQTNCADCARAVERTWRGNEEFAAGRKGKLEDGSIVEPRGEQVARMEDWLGDDLHEVARADDVHARLLEAGHGSSVVIETQYSPPYDANQTGGHAFNAVNCHGEVRVVDGQTGRTYDWNPGVGHPLMGRTWGMKAYGWNGKGEPLWAN